MEVNISTYELNESYFHHQVKKMEVPVLSLLFINKKVVGLSLLRVNISTYELNESYFQHQVKKMEVPVLSLLFINKKVVGLSLLRVNVYTHQLHSLSYLKVFLKDMFLDSNFLCIFSLFN